MPKRPCTRRAKWRLLPGKAAQRLSAHYQLDCDYGTPLIAIFKASDNNEPIYLCEAHVAEVERSSDNSAKLHPTEVHSIEARANRSLERAKSKEQTSRTPPTAAASNGSTPQASETQRAHPQPLTKPADQINRAELAPAKPNGSAPSNAGGPAAANSTERSSPARTVRDSAARTRVRDLTYGDSDKALVDEAIWNLAPGDYEAYRSALQRGRPAVEAAQAAGGQLAVMVRKISEYAGTLEGLLSSAPPTINAAEVIDKPLEQATLDLIGNNEIADAEKDAAIEQLGALQASLNQGLDLQISLLQALKIAFAVAERANWSAASSDLSQPLKLVYAAIYTNVRKAIVAAVPDALAPFERLANLYVAKAELDSVHHASHQESTARDCDTVSTTA